MLFAELIAMFWFSVISHGFNCFPLTGKFSARSSIVSWAAKFISLLQRGEGRTTISIEHGMGWRKRTCNA